MRRRENASNNREDSTDDSEDEDFTIDQMIQLAMSEDPQLEERRMRLNSGGGLDQVANVVGDEIA